MGTVFRARSCSSGELRRMSYVPSCRICADHQEILARRHTAMTGAGRQDDDISRLEAQLCGRAVRRTAPPRCRARRPSPRGCASGSEDSRRRRCARNPAQPFRSNSSSKIAAGSNAGCQPDRDRDSEGAASADGWAPSRRQRIETSEPYIPGSGRADRLASVARYRLSSRSASWRLQRNSFSACRVRAQIRIIRALHAPNTADAANATANRVDC